MKFKKEYPPINIGADISLKSFQIIEEELKSYSKTKDFNSSELKIITRLIHTSSCFDEVLNGIFFTPNAVERVQRLLLDEAKIIVDVNMIKAGINDFYLSKYRNDVICYINEPYVFEMAEKNGITRSYASVSEAIERYKDSPMILACGNAPTFIYSAVNKLLEESVNLKDVALLLFPVGFVNVIEAKGYGRRFAEHFDVPAIIMQGRFGGSTMVVATIHSIYKLIKNYNNDSR